MRILSIGKEIEHPTLEIDSVQTLDEINDWEAFCYDYVIIHGGDGAIRRAVTCLQKLKERPTFILNPTGSFNVVAKIHRVPPLKDLLDALAENKTLPTQKHHIFRLNEESFLFSAGNMGDMQHIFLAETFRFGILKRGMAKYVLALFFLLPVHICITPFMLLSSTRFFIFTPLRLLGKIGSFYAEVPKSLTIDLQNNYNMIELDGDIVTIKARRLNIRQDGYIKIVTK